jgi:Ca2+-binding EF-hand superfamily protein
VTAEKVDKLIDHALEEDDMDNDGMVSWEEFMTSLKYHEKV